MQSERLPHLRAIPATRARLAAHRAVEEALMAHQVMEPHLDAELMGVIYLLPILIPNLLVL